MRESEKRLVKIVLLIIIIVFGFYAINSSFWNSGFAVSSLNGTSNTSINNEVQVDMWISNITDLDGIQADVAYNPDVLNYTGISEGNLLNENGLVPTYFNSSKISVSNGVIKNILIFRKGVTQGVNGSGLLFSVTFNTIASGTSNVGLSKILLSDSNGNPITTSISNTTITVSSNGTTSSGGGTSGGGGSSGGGGGSSANPGTTVVATAPAVSQTQKKETVSPNYPVIFKNFDRDTAINQIQLTVYNPSKNLDVQVSKYNGVPAEVSVAKAGKVYKYLRIEVNNKSLIQSAKVLFDIDKSWIKDNNLDTSSIALFEFDKNIRQWNEVKTNYIGETGNYYEYQTISNGFSYFAIAEKTSNINLGNLWFLILIGTVVVIIIIIIIIKKITGSHTVYPE